MAQQVRRSPRDEIYLKSTSFEVYMVSGLVFVGGFTLAFVLSVLTHHELWLWPGMVAAIIVAAVVHARLVRREQHNKLLELEAEEAELRRR